MRDVRSLGAALALPLLYLTLFGYALSLDVDQIPTMIRDADNKPVFDKSRYYFDLSASYNLKLYHNKIRTRIQLNVRNVFERGRLQAVAVNPDGQPFAYRIIDPRLFILSTTFDL